MLTNRILQERSCATKEEYFEIIVEETKSESGAESYKILSRKEKADFWDYVHEYHEDSLQEITIVLETDLSILNETLNEYLIED